MIVAAALVEAYVKRNRKRSLADMRPDPDDISKVAGIERHGMDPVTLAQAEHRRLEEEGWAKRPEERPTMAQIQDTLEKMLVALASESSRHSGGGDNRKFFKYASR